MGLLQALLALLLKVLKKLKKPATHIVFLNDKGEIQVQITLHEGNTIRLTAQGKDDNKVNRDLDIVNGNLDWKASAEGVVAISPIPGTLFADLSYVGPGTVTVTCIGDADLTAAVSNVTGTIDVATVAKPIPLATSIEISAGAETPIP